MHTCRVCGVEVAEPKRGRKPQYCGSRCRVAAHRERKRIELFLDRDYPRVVNTYRLDGIPLELRSLSRWLLHENKRPKTIGGWWASVNDPTACATYSQALNTINATGVEADGLGFVLNGDGIVCVDLDDCVVDGKPSVEADELIRALGDTYVEYSPSGRGLHIWGYSDIRKGRVFKLANLKVEVYPNKRFITMTGNVYREGGLAALNITNALRLVA